MATPMTLPYNCCLCYGRMRDADGTFDNEAGVLYLVNVCPPCRMAETKALILRFAAYEGNGHPDGCKCLECNAG